MKISNNTASPLFFMPSSPKKNKILKPIKLIRRPNNHIVSLSKNSVAIPTSLNTYQIIPMQTMWTNAQLTSFNPIVPFTNTNLFPIDTSTPSEGKSSLINQSQQNVPIYPSYKPFSTPRVTTTLVPLNVCPTEYCQTTKSTSSTLVHIMQNHQEQNIYEHKSKDTVITHLIDDWIIRESPKPFQRKENEQIIKQEKKIISNESIISRPPLSSNVDQWTLDDVCSFFERVLGKSCYASLIQEHLIDGAALLLLEDEHLVTIFQMQLGPRLKLLDRIQKLKKGDLFLT
ncbi:hypothetical protein I4U23_028551 [Adineta vaga]|nr:hypothetical protein I4U23_028551 [Adineta vaga]